MARENYLFTSESVSEGHPDKVCDQISDAVLDLLLTRYPEARAGVETAATTNAVVLLGEIKLPEDKLPSPEELGAVARETIREIGYEQDGFHHRHARIEVLVHEQSADIAQGVNAAENKDEGAGDQGIMFGYATDETPELMPAPILYSHKVLKVLADARRAELKNVLGPDAKSQITVEYRDGRPVRAHTIVLSTQHLDPKLESADVREIVAPYITKTLPEGWVDAGTIWHVNPTGRFVIGGPDGDAGLTGRKIIVDTYGGAAPHGGGAFSGKDPTKVDRSAAYAARYLAKNVVAAGMAKRCCIQLAYAIGVAEPLSIYVDTYGTGEVAEEAIEKAIRRSLSLTPRGIRLHLGLNKPIYKRTAAYGHFGREPDAEGGFSWEKADLVEKLKANL
jgi:S-adenosylmethionine synthetase